jgi:hypothetical protein
MRRWCAAFGLLLLATMVPWLRAQPARASDEVTYTYVIAVKGTVRSDVNEFAAHAAATFADSRGWSLGGSVRFVRVEAGGDFTLWLSQPSLMTSFSSDCDAFYAAASGGTSSSTTIVGMAGRRTST